MAYSALSYRPKNQILKLLIKNVKSKNTITSGIYRAKWRQSLRSRYDRHFAGITQYKALSKMAKIYRVIQIKLN